MPLRIAVIAEADADRRHACELIDRLWQEADAGRGGVAALAAAREYCRLEAGSDFTRWRDLKRLKPMHGALRGSGFIGFGRGKGLHYDYAGASIALNLAVLAKPAVQAVLLIRDMDRQAKERHRSLATAQAEVPPHVMEVVLALPTAKREAWVLNGFEPRNQAEHKALAGTRKDLSFDPCEKAEELDAMRHGDERDAKRVLSLLTKDDHDREAACWLETGWPVLHQRGVRTGLVAFLEEARTRLLPRFTPT